MIILASPSFKKIKRNCTSIWLDWTAKPTLSISSPTVLPLPHVVNMKMERLLLFFVLIVIIWLVGVGVVKVGKVGGAFFSYGLDNSTAMAHDAFRLQPLPESFMVLRDFGEDSRDGAAVPFLRRAGGDFGLAGIVTFSLTWEREKRLWVGILGSGQ
jgi:hypothetical protein